MYQLVVFDMAGTTVDEQNVVYLTVHAAINAAGYSFSSDEVLFLGAGKEKSQAIRDVLATTGKVVSEAEIARIFADFQVRIKEAYDRLNVLPQPGALSVFKTLRERGIRVALNTGYDRSTAEKLLAKLGWSIGRDIDALVTASDVNVGRPAPDMIAHAMESLGIKEPGHVVKVGDSQIDIHEGRNAGCGLSIGITTGAHTREQLAAVNPDAIIDALPQLLPLLAVTCEVG